MTKPTAGFMVIREGERSGFRITFENGYSLSVQFGTINYCHRLQDDPPTGGIAESQNAEIAVINPKGEFMRFPEWGMENEVTGWQGPYNVAAIMPLVAGL